MLKKLGARRNPARVVQAGATRWQKVVRVLKVVKEYADEVLEELVLEPIFGEWFYTAHSMAGQGGGHKRGTLQSGVQANAQSAIQGWEGAVAKLAGAESVTVQFLLTDGV